MVEDFASFPQKKSGKFLILPDSLALELELGQQSPRKIHRVKLELHLFSTNENVKDMKRRLPRKPDLRPEELGDLYLSFAPSPERQRLAWRHLITKQRHHLDLLCFIFVKVFHKRLLV